MAPEESNEEVYQRERAEGLLQLGTIIHHIGNRSEVSKEKIEVLQWKPTLRETLAMSTEDMKKQRLIGVKYYMIPDSDLSRVTFVTEGGQHLPPKGTYSFEPNRISYFPSNEHQTTYQFYTSKMRVCAFKVYSPTETCLVDLNNRKDLSQLKKQDLILASNESFYSAKVLTKGNSLLSCQFLICRELL